MELRSQDTLIATAIWSLRKSKRDKSVRDLAELLGISAGEISKGVRRLIKAGLIVERDGLWHPRIDALCEWLGYGLRYAYPAKRAGFGRGMGTAWNCPLVQSEMVPPVPALVWAKPGGEVEGVIVDPIHPKVPQAASSDDQIYRAMALVDAIRLAKPRELVIARRELQRLLEETHG